MGDTEPTMTTRIKDAAIGWGVPLLFSSIPFIAWYNVFTDFLRALGWRLVTAYVSVLMFFTVRMIYLWFVERGRRRELEARLKNDYRQFLEPVPGKGVYCDKRTGEIICPRCVADKNTPSPMYKADLAFQGESYVCGACQNTVRR